MFSSQEKKGILVLLNPDRLALNKGLGDLLPS